MKTNVIFIYQCLTTNSTTNKILNIFYFSIEGKPIQAKDFNPAIFSIKQNKKHRIESISSHLFSLLNLHWWLVGTNLFSTCGKKWLIDIKFSQKDISIYE